MITYYHVEIMSEIENMHKGGYAREGVGERKERRSLD